MNPLLKSFRSSILLSDDPSLKTKREIKSQLLHLMELSSERSTINNHNFNKLYVELEELLRASRKKSIRQIYKNVALQLLAKIKNQQLFQQLLNHQNYSNN